MWMCTCIDVSIGLILRTIVNWICYLTTASLFWFIERIIVPNMTVEDVFAVLIWFMAPPLIIINLLSTVLPTFYNYKTRYRLTFVLRTGTCSSGRHGKRGRHSDRHHTWWHGSQYRNKDNNKEDSPRKKHRIQRGLRCNKEREICRKIDLLQYFDPIIIPSNMFVIDDDVFYDANSFDDWLPPDLSPTLAITTKTINMLVDSLDVLSHYKQIRYFEDVSFFNSSYRRLDPSSIWFNKILIQARHLKLQVFHYDTTLVNNSNSPEIYVSSNNEELPLVIHQSHRISLTTSVKQICKN
jgi:hypothetical protein